LPPALWTAQAFDTSHNTKIRILITYSDDVISGGHLERKKQIDAVIDWKWYQFAAVAVSNQGEYWDVIGISKIPYVSMVGNQKTVYHIR
jgi:hypothetical protein